MKRYTKMMCYLISTCLCVWYLTVVYWAKHPNVCKEYELYYIKKQLKDWPGYGGLRYDLGEQLFFGTEENGMKKIRNRGLGWSLKEKWGSWTEGKNAHLYFIINKKITSDLNLTMMSDAFCPEGFQAADIFANDIKIGKLRFKDTILKDYQFTIPKEIIKKDGWLHLEFIIQNPSSPSQYGLSKDDRMLGIGMNWIKIESMDKNEYL